MRQMVTVYQEADERWRWGLVGGEGSSVFDWLSPFLKIIL